MRSLRRITHRIEFPRDIEIFLKPMVERLLADDMDGMTLQTVIRPYFLGARPTLEIHRGDETISYVEGPNYIVGDEKFPLGARIHTDIGWVLLDPIHTVELQKRLRAEIDRTVFRFLAESGKLETAIPRYPDADRENDDRRAIAAMIAWVSGKAPSETADAY